MSDTKTPTPQDVLGGDSEQFVTSAKGPTTFYLATLKRYRVEVYEERSTILVRQDAEGNWHLNSAEDAITAARTRSDNGIGVSRDEERILSVKVKNVDLMKLLAE